MAKSLDCGISVSEFELQSRYYVSLPTNTLQKSFTAIGHGKVIMQESKDYYEDRKWGRRSAGLRALATVKDQPRRGKGLYADKEKTCHWSRQGGRFTTKMNETQNVSSNLR